MYVPSYTVTEEAQALLSDICVETPVFQSHHQDWPQSVEQLLQVHVMLGGAGIFRQSPPAPHWIPVLLEGLIAWLHSTTTHPLIRAAVFHYELMQIRPFENDNSKLSCHLQKMILNTHHPRFGAMNLRWPANEYNTAMTAVDASDFITLSLHAILRELRAYGSKQIEKPRPRRTQSPAEQILNYLKKQPGSKRQDIMAAMPSISARMLDRHLQQLRESGAVEYRGSRKTGAYYPAL